MTPDAIGAINEAARGFTPMGIMLIWVVGFVVGWWITPGRFADAQKYGAEGWRQAEENRRALVAITTDMEKMIRAIETIGPTLKELARDHTELMRKDEEVKQCVASLAGRLDAIESEWRVHRKSS